MTEEYMTSAEIKRKIAELKIRLAFQMEFEEELERTLAECKQADENEEAVMKADEAKIFREIDAAARKARAKARRSSGRPRAWKVVAMAAVLMIVSIGSALAAICGMIEAGILKVDVQEKGTVFRLIVPDKSVAVPDGWKGKYYPTYIPEGYNIEYINEFGVCYVDVYGNELKFDENIFGERRTVDTEGTFVSSVFLEGSDAMVVEKDGWTTILWSLDNKYFVVEVYASKETALRIAASVERISWTVD